MSSDHEQREQGTEAGAYREALRRERTAARESLPALEHARKSAALLGHLRSLLLTRHASTLAFYWPIRAEPDCRPLVTELLALGWRASLPVVVRRAAPMEFHEWTPQAHMVAGEHGIPTVSGGRKLSPDILLLPVNAFDAQGYRLGYGGGYFDRTLAVLVPRPFAVGVGFELARAESIAPHAQDCALNAVVTEAGVELFSGQGREKSR